MSSHSTLARKRRPYHQLIVLPDGRKVSPPALAHELGVTTDAVYQRLRQDRDPTQVSVQHYHHVQPGSGGARRGSGRPRGVVPLGTPVTQEASGLLPEQLLIAAKLRVMVNDAKSQAHYASTDGQRIAAARAWLLDRAEVLWWLDLAGLPETTYDALLIAAGLEETS